MTGPSASELAKLKRRVEELEYQVGLVARQLLMDHPRYDELRQIATGAPTKSSRS